MNKHRGHLRVCSVTSHTEAPRAAARQAPLSMGFSRQEHWSGLPCPPPGDLPHPGVEPASPVSLVLQTDSFPAEPSGKRGGHLRKPCLAESEEACLHCMWMWEWVGFTVGALKVGPEAWALFCRYWVLVKGLWKGM